MADEVEKLTGEERVDALCAVLSEKYGFKFPEEVFVKSEDEDDAVKEAVEGKKTRKKKKAVEEPVQTDEPSEEEHQEHEQA